MVTQDRNRIAEILERQDRLLRHTKRWQQVERRIHPILFGYWLLLERMAGKERLTHESNRPYLTIEVVRREFLKHIPVGSISCLEGWFRMAVADLIDHGSPFSDNVKRYTDIKFDVRTVIDLRKRTVSLGAFVAHALPANRRADIISNLSTVIGGDFLKKMKHTRINPKSYPRGGTFSKDMPMVLRCVDDAFDLRHIFCHEIAPSHRFSTQRIEDCGYGVFMFLVTAERTVQDLLGES